MYTYTCMPLSLSICMYVCMYVYIYLSIYLSIYVSMYLCINNIISAFLIPTFVYCTALDRVDMVPCPSGGTKRATSVNTPLLRPQSSEGKFAMSREIEPAHRSFRRRRSCTFNGSGTLGALW